MNKEDQDKDFINSKTLGHAKDFRWKIDNNYNIIILRKFRSSQQIYETLIRYYIINDLIDYLPNDEWFHLANNVEKLANGTEINGIGKYLYDQGFSNTDCQTASHLGTIFYQAGIWLYNGQRKRIGFKKNSDILEWVNHLKEYYFSHLQESNM
jgi:hypothetical protein